MSPNEVRGLDMGDCFAIHRGAAALLTVALPAGAFGQPPPDWLDKLRPVPALSLAPPAEQVTPAGSTQDDPPTGWGLSQPGGKGRAAK